MMVERQCAVSSVRTALETAMLFPPSATVLVSPSRLCLAAVPTTMASDLSGLRESVECEPSMNSIEAVVHRQQRTRPVHSDVKLSVVGILCVFDVERLDYTSAMGAM